jgi:hypothetical protein
VLCTLSYARSGIKQAWLCAIDNDVWQIYLRASARWVSGKHGRIKMKKLLLASILGLAIIGPVQAQNPTQGDYYPFRPTPVPQVTPQQEQLIKQGDYYVARVTPPSMRRLNAVKTCTDGIKFDSDRYVACMLKEGENP